MAKTIVWIDQLREAGESPAAVSKLVRALEANGLDVQLCYKDPKSLQWLSQAQAMEHGSMFRRWWTPVLAMIGLILSLGVIAIDWPILR